MPETRMNVTPDTASPRPCGAPEDAVRVVLPHSEVCMHMQIAGQTRWVAPVDGGMAQIYNNHGSLFSAPVTRAEAGIDEHGQPMSASRLAA
jgi:hypothetical protein